jgi:hypothetical protein
VTRRAEVAILMTLTAIAAAVMISTQPRDAFWGSDSASRFIQVESLLHHGNITIEHRWPLSHHFITVKGKTYSYWSPSFPVLAMPLFRAFGFWGLFILPIAGTLLIIALLPSMTKGSILPVGIAIVFATPIFWYTIVFWEHTLAAACALAAMVLAKRDRVLIAGIIAAAGAVLREEGYVVIAALAVALFVSRHGIARIVRFLAAAAVVLVPWAAINWSLFGSPRGLHAAVYSSLAGDDNVLGNIFPFLFEFSRQPAVRYILIAPAVALIAAAAFEMPAWVRVTLLAVTTVGFVLLTASFIRAPLSLGATLYHQGLFPAVPFSVVMFLSLRRLWNERRFETVTVIIGVVLTTLLLNRADFGVIWGPRHYLWLLPLMIILGIESLADFATFRTAIACGVVLLACSFAIQTDGLRLLRAKLDFNSRLLQAIRVRKTNEILTDVFWVPEELAATFYERDIGFVRNDGELQAALRAIGNRPFVYIASREGRLLSNEALGGVMARAKSRQRIQAMDVDLMLVDVGTYETPTVKAP